MRFLLHAILTRFVTVGRLTVQYPDGRTTTYGSGDRPLAGAAIRTWRTVRGLLTNPALVFGEAYVAGDLQLLDCRLEDLLHLLFGNLQRGGTHPGLRLRRALARLLRRVAQYNPLDRARRNAARHYDLDGRLYAQFLDRDRNYSCAYFTRTGETLEEAQAAKKHLVARKLLLTRPGLHVLDIGSGWGGMAITLAGEYGARVTGITLSAEQLDASRARAEAAGLSDRVRFELADYRTWTGSYDRIVSVGMFEHVGITHYREYFRCLRELLTPDGVALVHAIGRSDGPSVTNPWITRHIFPGGYSPALSEVFHALEREKLIATDLEILRLHYAETIRHWRRRFEANRDAVAALYDERFCRMFELYLVGSEFSFRHLNHMVWQLQLARHQDAVPLTRDYMGAQQGSTSFLKKEAKNFCEGCRGQMLKLRVIPCLDVKEGRVVKGINFVDLRDAGDPVEQATIYDQAGADELTFLDITASHERRDTILDMVQRTAAKIFLPFTVGGGVRSTDDMRRLLLAGADKCGINSAAIARPALVAEAAETFGSQCVVAAVDARATAPGRWEVFSHGGRTATGLDAVAWCRQLEALGAGEILLTSMDRDGTGGGFDTDLLRAVCAATRLPVVASGGVGRIEHFAEGARAGATGLLAASVFHFGTFTVPQVKAALAGAGLPVRQAR